MPLTDATTFEISHKGAVSTEEMETATQKIRAVAKQSREPIHHVEVRLTHEAATHRTRPAIVEVTFDVDGQPVRAHEAAGSVAEVVDLVVDRLTRRLRRHEDRRHRLADRHRTGHAAPGEWRHGDLKSEPAEYTDVPPEDREIRRHKTLARAPMSIEEAAFDLDLLGHSFYLFVEEESGLDAALVRTSDQLTLQWIGGGQDSISGGDLVGATPGAECPVLAIEEARSYLENAGVHELFFESDTSGRGQVLYRRFDGHYGLVTAI